ncbi:hypothetical protein AALA80_16890, partial [Oscillospiraceae bacterium 50-60]
SAEHCYYNSASRVCQPLFSNFFQFFSCGSTALPHRLTALLEYQIALHLSTHFLHFFLVFSTCPALSPIFGTTSVQNRKWAVQANHDMV